MHKPERNNQDVCKFKSTPSYWCIPNHSFQYKQTKVV